MVTAPAARACIVVSAPATVSVEQMTTGVGRSDMIFLRKVMPSMRGISTSKTTTSGQLLRMRCIAKIGSATAARPSIDLSLASAPEITWRTTAESSTTITLILCIGVLAAARQRPGGLLQPHIAAPEVEHDVAVPVTAEVLGVDLEAVQRDELAAGLDVAVGDVDVALPIPGVREHAPAAEELHLVLARPRAGVLQFALEHQHDFLGVAPVERLDFRAVRSLREQGMGFATDATPRGPEWDRHPEAEQSQAEGLLLAPAERPRLERDFDR